MYAVVGCNECTAMWLLSDPDAAETATCPRCGKRHRTKRLKRFFESADRAAAREARSALLAKKHGDSEAFADVAHVAELEEQFEHAGIDDEEYLAGSGLDPEAIESAGDRDRSASPDRETILREAIETAGTEGRTAVLGYASERGVPRDRAASLLDRLVREGEALESAGRYRLL